MPNTKTKGPKEEASMVKRSAGGFSTVDVLRVGERNPS